MRAESNVEANSIGDGEKRFGDSFSLWDCANARSPHRRFSRYVAPAPSKRRRLL